MKGFNSMSFCPAQTIEMVQLWLNSAFKTPPVCTAVKGKDDGSLEIRLSGEKEGAA